MYTLERLPAGTLLNGLFAYRSDGLWRSLIDGLVVRQRLAAESREAVLRLKRLMEQQSGAGDQDACGETDNRAGLSRRTCPPGTAAGSEGLEFVEVDARNLL